MAYVLESKDGDGSDSDEDAIPMQHEFYDPDVPASMKRELFLAVRLGDPASLSRVLRAMAHGPRGSACVLVTHGRTHLGSSITPVILACALKNRASHTRAGDGWVQVVQQLLSAAAGAKGKRSRRLVKYVNAQVTSGHDEAAITHEGGTALHYASGSPPNRGSSFGLAAVTALLRCGADVTIKNSLSQTAQQFAEQSIVANGWDDDVEASCIVSLLGAWPSYRVLLAAWAQAREQRRYGHRLAYGHYHQAYSGMPRAALAEVLLQLFPCPILSDDAWTAAWTR